MSTNTRLAEITEMVNAQMAAAERGDLEAVKGFYTPDAQFWMNVTNRTQGLKEQFEMVTGMRGRVSHIRYVDISITPFEGGYVQQHRAVGGLPDGRELNVSVCFICHMQDDKISFRQEYLDSGQLSVVQG